MSYTDGRKISEMVLAAPLQGTEYFEIIQKDTGNQWKNRRLRLDTISAFAGGGGGEMATPDGGFLADIVTIPPMGQSTTIGGYALGTTTLG